MKIALLTSGGIAPCLSASVGRLAENYFINMQLMKLFDVKSELEDLGLKYTEPETFKELKNKIEETKVDQDKYIKHV